MMARRRKRRRCLRRCPPYATARALPPAAPRPWARPLEVILQEEKYHQVRRMLAARGMPVTYLRRDAEGGLTLQGLPAAQSAP